ncbi:type II secretion system protein [Phytohabitans suffuscus]|uniref:Type II secretion system protein n=1 Tax=Phytohabitans suffuscus TaxID=624315 RepID=A0A6F8YJG3_9ACTN|nr:type II secretion system protein [Phytohabitans suffuscus]
MTGPADIELIALLSGAACVGGLVLAVMSIVGTRSPVKPPSPISRRLSHLWNGTGRTAAQRRRHRTVLVSAIVAGALAWMVTGLPMVGLLVGIAVPGAPWLFGVGQTERRAIARIEAVGEWTRRLRDVSSTGQGLQQAIIATVSTAPEEIGDEVALLAARLQAGWHARDALLAFAGHLGDPMCDQVVAALILHLSDRGERLGDVLSSIATAAAAEVATRREVEAKRTQPRFAVRFLTGMTLLTLAYGLLNPQYMEPYGTPTGQVVLVVLGGTFVALLAWTRTMSLPPAPVRFLAIPDERRES